jgi:hypothetical protein
MKNKYQFIFKRLIEGINNLEKDFILAEAHSLKTLNNIVINYRCKMGLLTHEPLSNFKLNKY